MAGDGNQSSTPMEHATLRNVSKNPCAVAGDWNSSETHPTEHSTLARLSCVESWSAASQNRLLLSDVLHLSLKRVQQGGNLRLLGTFLNREQRILQCWF